MDNKVRNEKIMQITCEMIDKMNFQIDKAFVEDVEGEENQVLVGLTVQNPAGLIGYKGRNLAAIQLVLSLIVKQQLGEWVRILLDINNYRTEQKERLMAMARSLAEKVKATGKEVMMAAMSSYERRICHMALVDIEGITQDSEGEGEERHIVIKPLA